MSLRTQNTMNSIQDNIKSLCMSPRHITVVECFQCSLELPQATRYYSMMKNHFLMKTCIYYHHYRYNKNCFHLNIFFHGLPPPPFLLGAYFKTCPISSLICLSVAWNCFITQAEMKNKYFKLECNMFISPSYQTQHHLMIFSDKIKSF